MRSLCIACLLPVLAALAADAPATFKVGDYTFTRPVKWESVQPSSSMRKAQLRVPGDKGQSADVIFFHFGPGGGGGTQANIDRWQGQFTDAHDKSAKPEKIGRHNVIYVTSKGTYSGGMPGAPATPLPNYALLGAIIESDGGNIFIKMTGPEKVVSAAEKDFRQMVASALK
jgi:hypothetical protein